jgi:hypothetical protein
MQQCIKRVGHLAPARPALAAVQAAAALLRPARARDSPVCWLALGPFTDHRALVSSNLQLATELREPMTGGGAAAAGPDEAAGLLQGSGGSGSGAASARRRRTAPPPPSAARQGLRLGLSTAQYVCCSLVSTTLFYRELYRLQNFPQFSNQINTTGTTVTMGLLALVLVAQPCSPTEGVGGWLCALGLDSLHFGDSIGAVLSGRLFAPWMLALFGFLNSLGNLLQLMAIDGLGPRYSTLTTLINQCTIPFTMLLSRLLLRNRYSALQLLGAAVVISGVGVAVSPSLRQQATMSSSASGTTDEKQESASTVAAWIAVFVVSCIPQSLLNVLIEQSLPLPPTSVELAYTSGATPDGSPQPQLRDVILRTVRHPESCAPLETQTSTAAAHGFDRLSDAAAVVSLAVCVCVAGCVGLADEPGVRAVQRCGWHRGIALAARRACPVVGRLSVRTTSEQEQESRRPPGPFSPVLLLSL